MIRWLIQLGILEDEAANVLFLDGNAEQTISLHEADDESTSRFSKAFCAFLSVVVQKDHCAKQRAGLPMSPSNYIRAALAISALFLVALSPLYFLWSYL